MQQHHNSDHGIYAGTTYEKNEDFYNAHFQESSPWESNHDDVFPSGNLSLS